jgi:hypothetical protein
MLKKITSEYKDDPQIKLFSQGLNLSSPDACAKSIKALDSIDRTNLKHAYTIDIMKANAIITQGKPDRFNNAIPLLIGALQQNQHLTGVYKDLGDIYRNLFNMEKAWQCYDQGFHIAPDHPLLQPITKHQGFLEKQFPDFF